MRYGRLCLNLVFINKIIFLASVILAGYVRGVVTKHCPVSFDLTRYVGKHKYIALLR